MRISATVDLSRFRGDMTQAAAAVRRGIEDGLNRAAEITLQAKQRQIGKTYARPIPSSPTGRRLWERKGDWAGGQAIERPDANTRHVVTRGPAEKYEGRLARLNTGADGINRSNPASAEAQRIIEPQCVAVIENAINNALRGL